MKEYYRNLAFQGKADRNLNGTHIFNIGQDDVHKFSELLTIKELWVLPSGNIQTIDIESIQPNHYGIPIQSLFDFQ